VDIDSFLTWLGTFRESPLRTRNPSEPGYVKEDDSPLVRQTLVRLPLGLAIAANVGNRAASAALSDSGQRQLWAERGGQ
jgi:hypothetical protein